MLRSSILQRVDVVASTMPRSCHCELKESWQMPPMGRNMLADHHWSRAMTPRQLMPRQNIDVRAVAEGDPVLPLFV